VRQQSSAGILPVFLNQRVVFPWDSLSEPAPEIQAGSLCYTRTQELKKTKEDQRPRAEILHPTILECLSARVLEFLSSHRKAKKKTRQNFEGVFA
jgi:hypothetical protein